MKNCLGKLNRVLSMFLVCMMVISMFPVEALATGGHEHEHEEEIIVGGTLPGEGGEDPDAPDEEEPEEPGEGDDPQLPGEGEDTPPVKPDEGGEDLLIIEGTTGELGAPETGLLDEVKAEVDALLEAYGLWEGMTEEEIEEAVWNMDGDLDPFVDMEALEELAADLSEEELDELLAYAPMETWQAFYEAVTAFYGDIALYASKTVSVLDGKV
ncbi:MAG: hypothetical protein IKU27_05475, partial [Clostridia bacterium]|nr:hypothetical protein [Clostridia bacterium]